MVPGQVLSIGEGFDGRQPRRPIFAQEPIESSITPVKLAALVVLDRDPRTVESEELHTFRVEMTMVGGREVHEAWLQMCAAPNCDKVYALFWAATMRI